MAVVCVGRYWLLDELGERRCFEAALSAAGFRHEEFTLQVNPVPKTEPKGAATPRYDVKVTHLPTRSVKAYRGGRNADWVTAFTSDLAGGLYGQPDDRYERDGDRPSTHRTPIAGRATPMSPGTMWLEGSTIQAADRVPKGVARRR